MNRLPNKKKKRLFTRTVILKYLKAYCERCHENGIKTIENLTLDHKDWDPSNNSIDNLMVLCLKCHRNKDQWDKKKWR